MTEKEYAKLIAKNLKRLAYEHQKSQADISRALDINKQTISSWFRGERTPKMKNIDMLCDYFGVQRSDIMEEQNSFYLESIRKEREFLNGYHNLNDTGKKALKDYLDYLMGKPEFRNNN